MSPVVLFVLLLVLIQSRHQHLLPQNRLRMLRHYKEPSNNKQYGHRTPNPLNTLALQAFPYADGRDGKADIREYASVPDQVERHFADSVES